MKKSIWLFILAVPLLGASCGSLGQSIANTITQKATEKVVQGVTGAQNVNINGNQVSVTGTNGETVDIGTGHLPADFPAIVPVYTSATPQASFTNGKTGVDKVWTITFESPDSASLINQFYLSALAADGWTTTYKYSIEDSYGYTAIHDTYRATVTISSTNTGKASIFMSISQESTNSNQ